MSGENSHARSTAGRAAMKRVSTCLAFLGAMATGSIADAQTEGVRTEGSGIRLVAQAYVADQPSHWRAQLSLAGGTTEICGSDYTDWDVEITGSGMNATPVRQSKTARSFHLDLTSLRPDGSGRAVMVNKAGVTVWYYDFESGSGPRIFKNTGTATGCVRTDGLHRTLQ